MGSKIFAIIFVIITFGLTGLNLYAYHYKTELAAQTATDATDAKAPPPLKEMPWMFAKSYFADAYYIIQLGIGKRSFNNFALVRAEDNELNPGSFLAPVPVEMRTMARFFGELNAIALRHGSKLIYYNPPPRPALDYRAYQQGMPWLDLNPKTDSFLNYLREYGVPFVDARYSLMNNNKLPPENIMYKTDPSWTGETSFATFTDLVQNIEMLLDISLDPAGFYRNPNNYSFIKLDNYFMGEFGKSSSRVLAGYDDFTAIMPRFGNRYVVETLGIDLEYYSDEGSAAEVLYVPEKLNKPVVNKLFDEDAYLPHFYYLHGLHPMAGIKNLNNPRGPKVLLVHDAYGVPVGCLLAPLAGELTMINPFLGQYTPDLQKYVADKDFDVIIIMMSIFSI